LFKIVIEQLTLGATQSNSILVNKLKLTVKNKDKNDLITITRV